MIVPMKKYSFLIFHREYTDFLHELRDLGVVHIQENTDTKDIEGIKQLLEQKKELVALRNRMEKIRKSAQPEEEENSAKMELIPLPDDAIHDAKTFRKAVDTIDQKVSHFTSRIQDLTRELAEREVWGEFDPDLLERLRHNGSYIHFWSIQTARFDPAWAEEYSLFEISQNAGFTYFITVSSLPEDPQLPADRMVPPMKSIAQIRGEIRDLERERERCDLTLHYLAEHSQVLEAAEVELDEQYNWGNALLQGEHILDDKIILLEGWIPAEASTTLEGALDAKEVAYTEIPIREGEKVPIILKNNFFARAFEPIVEMFSLPNYYELDPTPFVAPFFMLFFAMCFGDAGYGLLVLLFCTFYKPKAKEKLKPLLTLFQWLGGAAVVVGFFSGSFFGIELAKVDALARIRHFFISSNNMMVISIAIGLVQIIFGKFVAAYKVSIQKGVKSSLSNFAWVFFIIIMLALFLFSLPQLHITIPPIVNYIMYGIAGVCALLMVFYNSPRKNIFFNIGNSIWTAYNTASGLLGDTLSYIRLFAIGLTGAILGSVFNSLAFQMTEGIPWYIRWLPVLLILLLGHGINFGLTMIGALVHPIRLIYVEYFNNSEYEGGGKKYKPFRKEVPSTETV